MAIPQRTAMNRLTKEELVKLGKKYGVIIPTSTTKTGMISRIMGSASADTIRKDVERIINNRK